MEKKSNNKNKKSKVTIELEDDAEEIFLQALNNFDASAIDKEEFSKSDLSHLKTAKKNQRRKKISVDLHGLTLSEAQNRLAKLLDTLLAGPRSEVEVMVITGKGRHSRAGGGVLAKEVHAYVSRYFSKYITRIDSSPGDVLLEGVPIRGHFTMMLKL